MYKLLIVDDERLIRERLKFLLKTINIPLELIGEAKNGEEALALISEKSPDIVITDIRMPVMDGIELVKQAKLRNGNAKFIIVSGYAEFEYAKEALAAGVLDYVLRPVDSIRLYNSLQKACNEIDRMKKTNIDLQDKIELEASNVKKVIENDLNGLIFSDQSELKSYMNLVKSYPELEKCWYTLIIFHISNPKTSKFDGNDFDLIHFSIDNIIREIGGNKNVILFNNIRDKSELLAICFATTEYAVISECKAFASNCYINIDRFLHSALTIGIGSNYSSLSMLCECYRKAKHALMQRFAQGSNKIFNYSEVISKHKSNNTFFEPKLQTLDICFQNMNSYDSLKNLRSIVSSIFCGEDLHGASTEDIQILFSEVIRRIVSFCKHNSVDAYTLINEGVVRGDIISTFENSNDIVDYICCLIEKILQTEKTTNSDIKQLVHKTERYIKVHFYEDISLNSIAEQNHVDLKYLSKVFKSVVGSTFSDYLMKVRLERAIELLSTTDIDIQEIARSVGYSDHQYFHRLFKKKMSMTPNQYRMS